MLAATTRLAATVLACLCFASPGKVQSAGNQVDVKCTCTTAPNPSECRIATANFQDVDWWTRPHKPSGATWNARFLAEYCQRHADEKCFCSELKFFKGEEKK